MGENWATGLLVLKLLPDIGVFGLCRVSLHYNVIRIMTYPFGLVVNAFEVEE